MKPVLAWSAISFHVPPLDAEFIFRGVRENFLSSSNPRSSLFNINFSLGYVCYFDSNRRLKFDVISCYQLVLSGVVLAGFDPCGPWLQFGVPLVARPVDLMMEAENTSQTSLSFYQTKLPSIPEDTFSVSDVWSNHQFCRCPNHVVVSNCFLSPQFLNDVIANSWVALLSSVRSLGTSISIMSGYGLDDWGSIPGIGKEFFL
jgi:hypothetical protein